MNIMKLIILLGFSVIFSGTVASAQTAMGAGKVAATVGAPGQSGVFDAAGVFPGSGATSPQANNATIAKTGAANMNLNLDDSFRDDMQHPMGFAPAPGGPPQPATGQLANSSPGTNSIGTFGSGQSLSTNPANPITESPSGGTTITQGQTGETNAVTPGTSGTGQTGGSVPGTISANTVLATPVPGTESIGTFGSGQTIFTNPGNTFSAQPPGGTTIALGATGETNAITPGTSGTGQTGNTVPGVSFTGSSAIIATVGSAIPGTQSIGSFGSGQTIVTNPGNQFSVGRPGTATVGVGPSGQANAFTPGVSGSPIPASGLTFGSTTPTVSGSTFSAAVAGGFGGGVTAGSFGPGGRR